MYRVVSQSGHTSYGLKHYVCDLDSDINNLPITDIAGSEAYVIESGETYILSNAHEWKVKRSSSSSIDTSQFEEQIADLNETVDSLVQEIDALKLEVAALKEELEELKANDKEEEEEKVEIDVTNKVASIPESIATVNPETNTLVLTEENSEIVGNTLILK